MALIALKSGAPILPVAIEGAFEAYPAGAVLPKPHSIDVKVGNLLSFGSEAYPVEKTIRITTEQIMKSIERLIEELKNKK